MTTEVIIKNKSGIVLAADSAVTVTGVYGQKVYNSANKLFTLSKIDPVGILVYNSATINNVPIELIIKEFRQQKNSYDNLLEYQQKFIIFVEKFIKDQTRNIKTEDYFSDFLNFVIKLIHQENEGKQRELVDDFDMKNFIKKHEKGLSQICEKYNFKEDFSSLSLEKIKEDMKKNPVYQRFFTDFKNNVICNENLEEFVVLFYWYLKYSISQSYTGIAVCGYGTKDYFPKVHLCNIYGVINGEILVKNYEAHESEEAEIIPLAQRQMIDTFIKGVSDTLYEALEGFYMNNFDTLIDTITPSLKEDVDPKELKNRYKQSLYGNAEIFKKFVYEVEQKPLIQTINHLSRDEMAELAENLINIQVLKYKVSPNLETVGGPIDVAIISKHDGFVWRKRKLYFPKELNYQFFENYFK